MTASTDRITAVREHLCTPVLADVLDQLGRCNQVLPPQIRPIRPDMVVAGRAMPVLIADVRGRQDKPFGLLTEALDQLQEGEVYLGTSSPQCAAWGEILTVTARARGAVGAVLDGYHRDTHKVLELDWPVFSYGPWAQDAGVRSSVLDYRVPIQIDDVHVTPGDLVLGDIDGVVVVPQDIEDEAVTRAFEKVNAEGLARKAIEAGISSTEAFATYGVL